MLYVQQVTDMLLIKLQKLINRFSLSLWNAFKHSCQLIKFCLQELLVLLLSDYIDMVRLLNFLDVIPGSLLRIGLKLITSVQRSTIIFIERITGTAMRVYCGTNAHNAVIFPPCMIDCDMPIGIVHIAPHIQ